MSIESPPCSPGGAGGVEVVARLARPLPFLGGGGSVAVPDHLLQLPPLQLLPLPQELRAVEEVVYRVTNDKGKK